MTDNNNHLHAAALTEAFEHSGLAAAEFDITAIAGFSRGSLKRAVWPQKGEDHEDAFAALMAERGTGKEVYLAVRDEIRAALRTAETLQRARRRAENLLRVGGLSDDRERVYIARMSDRRYITRLIEARRAGKAWSRAARHAQLAAA